MKLMRTYQCNDKPYSILRTKDNPKTTSAIDGAIYHHGKLFSRGIMLSKWVLANYHRIDDE